MVYIVGGAGKELQLGCPCPSMVKLGALDLQVQQIAMHFSLAPGRSGHQALFDRVGAVVKVLLKVFEHLVTMPEVLDGGRTETVQILWLLLRLVVMHLLLLHVQWIRS